MYLYNGEIEEYSLGSTHVYDNRVMQDNTVNILIEYSDMTGRVRVVRYIYSRFCLHGELMLLDLMIAHSARASTITTTVRKHRYVSATRRRHFN